MKGSSFRDILAQFLEEKSETSPLNQSEPKHFQPEPTPLLFWKNENLRQTPKCGYPPPATRKQEPKREEVVVQKTAPERTFMREQLSSVGRDAAQTLLALGAVELQKEISLSLVKRAHRRLAKALHPDRIGQNLPESDQIRRCEQFLLLQAAYETLSVELKALAKSPSPTSAAA